MEFELDKKYVCYIELGKKYHDIALNVGVNLSDISSADDEKRKEWHDVNMQPTLSKWQKQALIDCVTHKYKVMQQKEHERLLMGKFSKISDDFNNELMGLCPLNYESAKIVLYAAIDSARDNEYDDDSYPLHLQHIAEEFQKLMEFVDDIQNSELLNSK